MMGTCQVCQPSTRTSAIGYLHVNRESLCHVFLLSPIDEQDSILISAFQLVPHLKTPRKTRLPQPYNSRRQLLVYAAYPASNPPAEALLAQATSRIMGRHLDDVANQSCEKRRVRSWI
nr:uncharacterized protein CTRU02_06992 [Colletotrichum truncatum]KAF6791808.1 hypothetical protein CTRU02_06992 [Colletotrichum truncatum]